jgi:hypothetical protein
VKNMSKMAAKLAIAGAMTALLTASAFADDRPDNGTSRRGDTRTTSAQDSRRTGRNDRSNGAGQGSRDRATHDASLNSRDNSGRNGDGQRNTYDRNRQDVNQGDQRAVRQNNDRTVGHDGRISTTGQIRELHRERDGYRVVLDRGNYSYWVPASRVRDRGLRVGLSVRLGGIFRGGAVQVDVLGWPGDPYYNDSSYNDGYRQVSIRGIVERVDYRQNVVVVTDQQSRRPITVDLRSIDSRDSRLDAGDLRRGDRITVSGSWLGRDVFGADRIENIGAY